jgi:WD40 repeat protein
MLAGAGGRIFVWDSQTGSLLANLRGADGGVRELEFSPDGSLLLTASSTAGPDRIALWAIPEGD